jgi:TRAP-type C4-dicarboxylate transport system permease large subunit
MNTIEYNGVVESVAGGKAQVEIRSAAVKDSGIPEGNQKRVVSASCTGGMLRPGDKVVVTGTPAAQSLVVFLGYILPLLMCTAIFLIFRHVTKGDDRLAMVVAGIFLFPYYSVYLLLRGHLPRDYAYRIKS